jgi:hypothetical protein
VDDFFGEVLAGVHPPWRSSRWVRIEKMALKVGDNSCAGLAKMTNRLPVSTNPAYCGPGQKP